MNAIEMKSTLESSDIFTRNGFTRDEYIDELLRFQSIVGQMILGDENARMDEVIAAITSSARKNGVTSNTALGEGIRGLKAVSKEIAIHMSGKKAEDNVAYSLTFVNRPFFQTFRNVCVSNLDKETEIDNVILTNSGIIVVEVKGAKTDITISEEGRLLYSNSESYHNESIGDKMELKRSLLKTRLESKLRERGLDIPVHIDSYVVFSSPKHADVTITDNYRKERWCRRGKLQYIVSEYVSDVTYSAEEVDQLAEIIGSIESNGRRFPSTLDLPSIRNNFLVLYDLITEQPAEVENIPVVAVPNAQTKSEKTRSTATITKKKCSKKNWNVAKIAASAAVLAVASLAMFTAIRPAS